jgi:hypothetical protein
MAAHGSADTSLRLHAPSRKAAAARIVNSLTAGAPRDVQTCVKTRGQPLPLGPPLRMQA